MFKKAVLFGFGFLLVSFCSFAKDFGVRGHVFEIEEEDILKVFARKLQKVDVDKLNNELKERTKAYVRRPTAVSDITRTKEGREFYYAPIHEVEKDIKDHRGNILHKKGHKVNALAHTSLKENLVFIDGDDEQQVGFAVDYKARKEAKIILVKGSPIALQKQYKFWIYFDQAGILTTKLGIKHVPAVVSQDGLRLKIQELKVEGLTFGNKQGKNDNK